MKPNQKKVLEFAILFALLWGYAITIRLKLSIIEITLQSFLLAAFLFIEFRTYHR